MSVPVLGTGTAVQQTPRRNGDVSAQHLPQEVCRCEGDIKTPSIICRLQLIWVVTLELSDDTMEYIRKPLTLKCGLTLSNRLVKAAMAEQMADCNGLPHERFYHAYSQWADGGWGMILTGGFFLV